MVNPIDATASRALSPTRQPEQTDRPTSPPRHGAATVPLSGELQGLVLGGERRTAPAQGAMAQRVNLPGPSARGPGAEPPRGDDTSLRDAKQRMGELQQAMDSHLLASRTAGTAEQKMEACGRFVDAARDAVAFHASLPRSTALRVVPDARVRAIREEAMLADVRAMELSIPIAEAQLAKREQALLLYARMAKISAERETPLDLSQLVGRIEQHRDANIAFWGQKASRVASLYDLAELAAALPSSEPDVLARDESARREQSGRALVARFRELPERVMDAAQRGWSAAAGSTEVDRDRVADIAADLNRHFDAFQKDIVPAFHSTVEILRSEHIQPLSKEGVTVLEDVLGRLAEFASLLEDSGAGLNDVAGPACAELKARLQQAVECIWLTAAEVTKTLKSHPREESVPPPVVAEAPAREAPAAAPGARRADKDKRNKARRRQSAGTSAPSEPPPAAAAPPAKAIVRSEFGSLRIVDAREAASASAGPSDAGAAAWRQRLSPEVLQQRLARLDELGTFDLPAQLSAVSQARREQDPDAARFITEQAVSRLNAQAAEMAACIEALDGNRKLLGRQLPVVHDKLGSLNVLLAGVRGQARALHENLDGAQTDHLKTYRFPTQAHIETLRGQGQLAKGELQALKGEPGNLFELKLQPSALRNGKLPRPIWLHIHTKEPVHAHQLATLDKAAFGATHLKSDEERGRNREWQDAQARAGHDNVMIYRGKITPELCRTLLDA